MNRGRSLIGRLAKANSRATDLLCEGCIEEAESILWQLLSFSLEQLHQFQQLQQD